MGQLASSKSHPEEEEEEVLDGRNARPAAAISLRNLCLCGWKKHLASDGCQNVERHAGSGTRCRLRSHPLQRRVQIHRRSVGDVTSNGYWNLHSNHINSAICFI